MSSQIYECSIFRLLFTLHSDKEEHKKQTGHLSYHGHSLANLKQKKAFDEIVRVLESAMGGVSKTRLMYKAYISH